MTDYSQAVLLEGDNPLGFTDLAVFVAPSPPADEALFVRRRRNLAGAERVKAAITERYAGIQHAQLVVVNVHGERSEEHTSELQSQSNLVCRLLLEKKKVIAHATSISMPCSPTLTLRSGMFITVAGNTHPYCQGCPIRYMDTTPSLLSDPCKLLYRA